MSEDTKKTLEEIEQAKKVSDSLVELRRKLDEAAKAGLNMESIEEDIKKVKEALFGLSDSYKAASEEVYKNSRSLKDLTAARRLHSTLLDQEVARTNGYLQVTKSIIEYKRQELEANKDNAAAVARLTEEITKLVQQEDEETRALKEANQQREAYNNISDQTRLVTEALTGVTDAWRKTLVGSVISSGNLSKGLDAVTAQMQEQITAANIVGSTLMKVQEMTILMAKADDAAAVSLMKYNNLSNDQIDSVLDMATSNRSLGFSQKEVAQNYQTLQETVVSFSGLTGDQRIEMAKLNSTMEQFGVNASTSAQSASLLMDTLGMTAVEVEKYQMELENFGNSIGKNLDQLNRELIESGPIISTYGNRGTEVFKKMSATAKALSMDISQLTGAFEGSFNTFEGAFENVGKLNSVLAAEGRMIDANAVLMGDAADVAQIFTGALAGTSLQYKALNGPMAKFYQMQIANAMGTSDMSLVMKVLKGDLDAVGDGLSYAARGYDEFMRDDFLTSAQNQQQMTDKLRLAFEQFGIAVMPIVRILTATLTAFNELADSMGLGGKILMGVVGAALLLGGVWATGVIVMGQYRIAQAAITAAKMADTAANVPAAASNYQLAAAMRAKAASAQASMYSMIALGAAVALVGVGIGAAALGVAQLAEAFRGADAGQIIGLAVALGILGFAMFKMTALMLASAPAAGAAAGPILALGAAIFLIGAGIGIAAAGMAYLVESFKGMNMETAGAILAIAAGLGILAFVMGKVAAVALIAGVGMALAFTMMSLFVASISGEDNVRALEGLNSVLTNISQMDFSNVRSNISEVTSAVEDMVDKFADMDEDKVVRMETIMTAATGGAPAAAATATVPTPMTPFTNPITSAVMGLFGPGDRPDAPNMDQMIEKIDALLVKLEKVSSRPVELTMDYKNTKAVASIVSQYIDDKS